MFADDEPAEQFFRPAAPSTTRTKRPLEVTPDRSRKRAEQASGGDPDSAEDGFLRARWRVPVRRGLIPATRAGRIAAAAAAILALGGLVLLAIGIRNFFRDDPRFRIASSSSIQIMGNSQVTRSELLSVFGSDLGRNIFFIPLRQRREALEQLPWVEHATVMRLLPDQLRVAIVERTPVAFVRQGSTIGLVDAHGVLLHLPPAAMAAKHYSFPVVTGISARDPLPARASRMHLYQQFISDLDSGGAKVSTHLSEVDVTDSEDIWALLPAEGSDVPSERYAPFPVTVKPLSRFQGNAETAETLRGLADGTVDVIIGTHKLLSPETRFNKLGLVIIDEEQRFGVEREDLLDGLSQVDVLGMSATPIPRTLEMGVAGIREMSTILTPPEERHPVLTFVGAYDDKQVGAAVRRELLRDGQVFFVHNRVSSIRKVAAQLAELVPEARIAVAHGQMNEHELEQIMVDFWERNYDVLVCTTIVESGLDIPNANTLIIDRADMYGLSQLHQLRGRVGRGKERAYAYFLYPPERSLSETAHERLATVAQHTEIGAGMYVAMKDLEIRGAGNLLGGEQSGHIAGVGFDLYVRMIGEAVNELKGDRQAEKAKAARWTTSTTRTSGRACPANSYGSRRTPRSPPSTPNWTSARSPTSCPTGTVGPARAGAQPA